MRKQKFIDKEIALIVTGIFFIIGIGIGMIIQILLNKI